MKPLELHIRKNGFDYHQGMMSDKGYLYAQLLDGKVIAYEVFRHKENTQFECVSFPGNEAFGTWAWTYSKQEDAVKKFESL